LKKELWSFGRSRISAQFECEWHGLVGIWFLSYGNEQWEFLESGLMKQRDDSMNDVAYGTISPKPSFQRERMSGFPFEETITRLRASIEYQELWLIGEIDTQSLMEIGGFASDPLRQLLFFHPRYMARILAINPSAVLEAPLKLAVLGSKTQEIVRVRWINPIAALARYGNPTLTTLAIELDRLCSTIVSAID
jgi:uncharacterized protein (DUF302 family)